MGTDEVNNDTLYKVVLNHEEQYSLWPHGRENPLGWNDAVPIMLRALPLNKALTLTLVRKVYLGRGYF